MSNIIALPGDDDDDGNASEKQSKVVEKSGVITQAQKEELEKCVGEEDALVERILKSYKVKTLAELQTKDFAAILNGVKKVKGVTV